MMNPTDVSNAKILIVDDQPANVLLLERMLHAAGYRAITGTTNPEAVCELHHVNRYDLILLDLQMPILDGFQILELLKDVEANGYLPVLVITAQQEQKLKALNAGAMDFVSKPFELAEVLARVRNMLEVRLLHLRTTALYEQLLAEKQQSFERTAVPGTMVGVEKEERASTRWPRSLRLRHPWLQVNLLTSLIGGAVVMAFQDIVGRFLLLAVFVPILTSQSSNTGSQALAITLRGLALGEVKRGHECALVIKEAFLGSLNGILVGAVAAGVMFVAARAQHVPVAGMLAVVVLLAMIGSCAISGTFGAIVPLALRSFCADPATASSIVLSTGADVASLGLLFSLAWVLVD